MDSYMTFVTGFFPFLVFGCAGSSSPCPDFLSCSDWGLLSSCGARPSRCSGFSCYGAQSLEPAGFSSLVHRLSCMKYLPRPGIKPVSPALAGRFLSTAPPGKSHSIFCCVVFSFFHLCLIVFSVQIFDLLCEIDL